MTTNNMINTPEPFSTTSGGTGVSAPTAHTLPVAEGASAMTFLGPLTNGQLLIGSTGADPAAAAIAAGAGITITNGAGTITIAAAGGGLSWSTQTGTTQAAAINNGYITNNAGAVTVTLPATAALGSIVAVHGLGAGGWILAANTSQTIQYGNAATSSAGSLASANRYDTCWVVCMVANTTWSVISSVSAGLTVA